MDARKQILAIIDAGADHIARRLDLVVAALAGLLQQAQLLGFNQRGLRAFIASSARAVAEARQIAQEQLALFAHQLDAFVAIVEPDAAHEAYDGSEVVLNGAHLLTLGAEQVRLLLCREFRQGLSAQSPFRMIDGKSIGVMTRAGATIRAKEYFYLTARKSLLDYFNEAQIAALRNGGVTQARILRDDGHAEAGATFYLVGGLGRTYSDIVNEFFHPRANAIVGL